MNPNLLFVRSSSGAEENDNDNPWDDTELIKAYEAAFKEAKDIVAGKNEQKENKKMWKKGQFCRSTFSEDGIEYEAKIARILDGDNCIVKYLGYGNEEQVTFSKLTRSNGPKARHRQIANSKNENKMEWDDASEVASTSSGVHAQRNPHFIPGPSIQGPPPPPPPPLFKRPDKSIDSNEALHAMLMSWYMSGYHTGYYEGLKNAGK